MIACGLLLGVGFNRCMSLPDPVTLADGGTALPHCPLSWSFTTLAVSAKNVMASVPDYLLIETAFTMVQCALVAPLTVLSMQSRDLRGRAASADTKPIAAA